MDKYELPTAEQLSNMFSITREQCYRYGLTYPPQKGWRNVLKQRILEARELDPNSCVEEKANVVLTTFFEE